MIFTIIKRKQGRIVPSSLGSRFCHLCTLLRVCSYLGQMTRQCRRENINFSSKYSPRLRLFTSYRFLCLEQRILNQSITKPEGWGAVPREEAQVCKTFQVEAYGERQISPRAFPFACGKYFTTIWRLYC